MLLTLLLVYCMHNAVNDVALCDCQNWHASRPHKDAQDTLLWKRQDLSCINLAHPEPETITL